VPSSTPTEIVTNTPEATNTPQATFTPTFVFTPTATIPFTIQHTPTDIPAGGNGPTFLNFGNADSCLGWIILSGILILVAVGSLAYAIRKPKGS
jgi:hypothetical protein